MTDVVGNPEEERRAEFYHEPWSQEAVSRYFYCKVRPWERVIGGKEKSPTPAGSPHMRSGIHSSSAHCLLLLFSDPAAQTRVGAVPGCAQYIGGPHDLLLAMWAPHLPMDPSVLCSSHCPSMGWPCDWPKRFQPCLTSFRVCFDA